MRDEGKIKNSSTIAINWERDMEDGKISDLERVNKVLMKANKIE